MRVWLAALMAGAALAAPCGADEEFESLFNGKDLEGWSGDSKLWSVHDGVLVGSTDDKQIDANSFLSAKKSYKNFVFKLKFKLRNHNSGIQFRSQQHDDYRVTGYQADIVDSRYLGILYEEGGRGILVDVKPEDIAKVYRKDEWNDVVVTADGRKIKLELNGVTTVEYTETDEKSPSEGIVALQLHVGPKMRVEFKDVQIRELP